MPVELPLGSSSPDTSSSFTFSRDVQPFESGELKWVQVQIPLSELEELDGEVRLKDPTKNFGKSEDVEVNDLDDEIGENEVEKIIDVIESNEESEAGYWYKVFKDYRNRDDELFFYHFKTGESQQTDASLEDTQTEDADASNLQSDTELESDTESESDDGPQRDLPNSDFSSVSQPEPEQLEPVPEIEPLQLNSPVSPIEPILESKLDADENEFGSRSTLDLDKSSSISPGSLLMASLLLKKSNARKIQSGAQDLDQLESPKNPKSKPVEDQTASNQFSRSNRLKRKLKNLIRSNRLEK